MGGEFMLGIETSCDETSTAVVARGGEVRSLVISSQARLHSKYGGVVPEVAGRAHLEALLPALREALSQAGIGYRDLKGVAVTRGPGLVGSLLVGLTAAKALCFALELPLLAVNHLEAHIYANFLHFPGLKPPLLCFVVSGGHTLLVHMTGHRRYRVLGETLDDAAGEAYDKIARFLGLGYPGGPEIDRLSEEGNPEAIPFPRALMHDGTYDFSLSGLKTAVINYVRKERAEGREISVKDVAASFQAAVVDVQVFKLVRAVEETGVKKVALAGGVAANRYLRSRLREALGEKGAELYYPPLPLCADNAAMVAYLGWRMLEEGDVAPLDVDAAASLPLPGTSPGKGKRSRRDKAPGGGP